MRYAKAILGLGLFVLCVVVGAFIPIGGGSAIVIGGLVGLVLCYLVLSQKRFLSASSGADEGRGEVDQKAIQQKSQSIQEAHTNDAIIMDQLKHPHG
jgi:hypothetical protein